MMTNFVAFQFTDNDFHPVLHEAIEYIHNNRECGLTQQEWYWDTIQCMMAFHTLRNIKDQRSGMVNQEYLEKTLKVSFLERWTSLDSSFEGYVLDLHTGSVFYHGY